MLAGTRPYNAKSVASISRKNKLGKDVGSVCIGESRGLRLFFSLAGRKIFFETLYVARLQDGDKVCDKVFSRSC